ncbi:MAG TPA: hypothetical protein DEO70_12045 [Bacteroidales bacterium]|nr:MAG: hypothetical protein A2X11_10035 [Bacteroidetes bacterium GWE2_42_24]OFY25851.1 MAG: hypothetical protein A2X09_09410 [Bacteroidetes bacterium GWF2_43_11]HBZ67559.1 hypothetical protein [Bacteroidales bacterium]
MPRRRTVEKNYKNAPFEDPIIKKFDVTQTKQEELQARIELQRQKECLMVTIQVDSKTKIMCLPHQMADVRRKYGV